ncbi:hypothetical protein JCM10213v2_006724 [Rhodosporidiobolus nylandii]
MGVDNVRPPFSLTDLPTETLQAILARVGGRTSPAGEEAALWEEEHPLYSLSLASKRLRELCLPSLFQASMAAQPFFAHHILRHYGHLITHIILAGSTIEDIDACILFLPSLPNILHLHLGQAVCVEHDLRLLSGAAFPAPQLVYDPKEREHCTALRAVLRRLKSLTTHRGESETQAHLAIAQSLEALELSSPSMYKDPASLRSSLLAMPSLKRLVLDTYATPAVGALDVTVAPWQLEHLRLSVGDGEEGPLCFLNLFAGTLRSLEVRGASDELLARVPVSANPPPSLLRVPFPALRHLYVREYIPGLVACTAHAAALRSLAIALPEDVEVIKQPFFHSTLPALFRSLPTVRHFHFAFTCGDDYTASTSLDPAASRRLQQICAEHGIVLSTNHLFNPFGEVRRNISWYSLDGVVTTTTFPEDGGVTYRNKPEDHLDAKIASLEDVLLRAAGLLGRLRATKDAVAVDEMLGWAGPLCVKVLEEQGKDTRMPGA